MSQTKTIICRMPLEVPMPQELSETNRELYLRQCIRDLEYVAARVPISTLPAEIADMTATLRAETEAAQRLDDAAEAAYPGALSIRATVSTQRWKNAGFSEHLETVNEREILIPPHMVLKNLERLTDVTCDTDWIAEEMCLLHELGKNPFDVHLNAEDVIALGEWAAAGHPMPQVADPVRRTGAEATAAGAVFIGVGTDWANPYTPETTLVRYPGTNGQDWEVEGRVHAVAGAQLAFHHSDHSTTWHRIKAATAQQCTTLYREHVGLEPLHHVHWRRMQLETFLDRARTELAGRDLVCTCAPDAPCHGDTLLQIANA